MNDISVIPFYTNWVEVADSFDTPAQELAFYRAVMHYARSGEEISMPELKGNSPEERLEYMEMKAVYQAFCMAKPNIDASINRKTAAKKAVSSRWDKKEETIEKEKIPYNTEKKSVYTPVYTEKKSVYTNENVNDNVNANLNENVKENAHENVNVNVNTDTNEAPGGAGVCVSSPNGTENSGKTVSDWGNFQKNAFALITAHNEKSAKNKIYVSKNLISFAQKECHEIVERLKGENPAEILNALAKYVAIAESDTWKTGYSVKNFLDMYIELSDKDFDMGKYLTKAGKETLKKQQEAEAARPLSRAEKKQRLLDSVSSDKRFVPELFGHYARDWEDNGFPMGEDYFIWQDEMSQTGWAKANIKRSA